MADEKVVTRFAPSPTGYLHVGGARTALFNWLWARRNNGTFILRIEDTDQKRNTPTATAQVIADLRWLGIDWDEGPEVGGPHGPYLQSQRIDLYTKYVRQLLDAGQAYYCLESVEELQAMREEAEEETGGFAYRRPDRFPTAQEVEQARAQGRAAAVRFAVPQNEPIVVQDMIRGRIEFAPGEVQDLIILKSDGFPTYNFACVVDDYLMGVTCVIRGQEHLNNTPGQQALWKALFGLESLPAYAHMSVTVSASGGKLSKRERPNTLREAANNQVNAGTTTVDAIAANSAVPAKGLPCLTVEQVRSFLTGESTPDMLYVDTIAKPLGVPLPEINIVDFFRSGYLPETLVNFLALLGWNPGNNREIMPLDELVRSFDLSRANKSNSLFDRDKLVAFNTEHLRMTAKDRLVRHLRAYLDAVDSPVRTAADPVLSRLIDMCAGARTLADIATKSRFAFIPDNQIQYDPVAVRKNLVEGDGLAVLALLRERIATLEPLTAPAVEALLGGLAEQRRVGLGKVAQPLRVALCGTTVSPSIFESVALLGKDKTLARIDLALQRLGAGS